jgi:hypothetical protein
MADNVISFYTIRCSERADEKPSEVELYQLTATDLSTTEKGKINAQLNALLFESICIQHKVGEGEESKVLFDEVFIIFFLF